MGGLLVLVCQFEEDVGVTGGVDGAVAGEVLAAQFGADVGEGEGNGGEGLLDGFAEEAGGGSGCDVVPGFVGFIIEVGAANEVGVAPLGGATDVDGVGGQFEAFGAFTLDASGHWCNRQ